MKKLMSVVYILLVLLGASVSVSAGDIPESLLSTDGAQVFFARVEAYHADKKNPSVEVLYTKKIKGDVKAGLIQTYTDPCPVGNFSVEVGAEYLFAYVDAHNPIYLFKTSGNNARTLQLELTRDDMWMRFEQYLHQGRYEKAEKKRTAAEQNTMKPGEKISLAEHMTLAQSDGAAVVIQYGGESYSVDGTAFAELAETLMLTRAETSVQQDHTAGFFVTLDGTLHSIYVTPDGRVDGWNGPWMSRLPAGNYTMKQRDYVRLCTLLPEQVQVQLLPTEGGTGTSVYILIALVCGLVILGAAAGGVIIRKRRRQA